MWLSCFTITPEFHFIKHTKFHRRRPSAIDHAHFLSAHTSLTNSDISGSLRHITVDGWLHYGISFSLACFPMLRSNNEIQFFPLKSCRKLRYLAAKTRYYHVESIVEGCNQNARAEINHGFEYVCKSIPLLKRYPCGQRVLHNINTPTSSSTPC